ncbi:General vesicular transport factor p115 [Papilio machaon]|uniref:General vesicular transport factor p115 n=1 Tax=Papilio machaon TaxID=76193 RepID=A0A194QVY0_PAPMA|nr:General vesicular transport factor p115 [Papilio machaon]
METFVSKLSEVSRHELYNKAAKHPQLRAKVPAEVLIDYEFCRLFKVLESVLIQTLVVKEESGAEEAGRAGTGTGEETGVREGGAALEQYKALIRQQDARLQELVAQLDDMLQQNHALQVTYTILTRRPFKY